MGLIISASPSFKLSTFVFGRAVLLNNYDYNNKKMLNFPVFSLKMLYLSQNYKTKNCRIFFDFSKHTISEVDNNEELLKMLNKLAFFFAKYQTLGVFILKAV